MKPGGQGELIGRADIRESVFVEPEEESAVEPEGGRLDPEEGSGAEGCRHRPRLSSRWGGELTPPRRILEWL